MFGCLGNLQGIVPALASLYDHRSHTVMLRCPAFPVHATQYTLQFCAVMPERHDLTETPGGERTKRIAISQTHKKKPPTSAAMLLI